MCIAPTQPFWAALGAVSRVCHPGSIADSQPHWALTYCYLAHSTASQNENATHCHRWDSNLQTLACQRTSLTARPSPNPLGCERCCYQGWCFACCENLYVIFAWFVFQEMCTSFEQFLPSCLSIYIVFFC
jgi:hypothetical protein